MAEKIKSLILLIRGQRVILDSDLAKIYGIPIYRFNEAVKRNRGRFPEDFKFQLTREDVTFLTSQNAISRSGHGGRRTIPYAFPEDGAVMAANILKSPRAVQMSVFVVRAFVKNASDAGSPKGPGKKKLAKLKKKITERLDVHETAIPALHLAFCVRAFVYIPMNFGATPDCVVRRSKLSVRRSMFIFSLHPES